MSKLNPIDIAALQGHVDRGDVSGYWRYLDAASLRETGRHDLWAVLVLRLLCCQAQGRPRESALAADVPADPTRDGMYLLKLEMIRIDLLIKREELKLWRCAAEASMSGIVSLMQSGLFLFTPDGEPLDFEDVDWRHLAEEGLVRLRP